MGDRANVVVQQEGFSEVFLYTHWDGWNLPQLVQTALRRHERWTDPQYLGRIVFCTMVKGHEDGETGYGISSQIGDNTVGRPLLVLDTIRCEVRFEDENDRSNVIKRYSFTDYCALDNPQWPGEEGE